MTKALIKKQLLESFSFFWMDRKKNKLRRGGALAGTIVLYIVLFGVLAVIFGMMANMLCAPLVKAGMGWLYFALMGLVGVVYGAFGSVFNTYAGLYQAKDNEMLLAMPIKPGRLLFARLTAVYAMGTMYELMVMLPVLVIYYIHAAPDFLTVVCSIAVTLLLSVFILTLSAVLGWFVALIGSKIKNKSFLTVILSLGFIAAYYYLYNKAFVMLQRITREPEVAGGFIRGKLYPVYQMGLAAEGDGIALLIFAAMVLALFAVVCFVLTKSFVRIATTNRGARKKVYRERGMKVGTVSSALLRKELWRFTGSPNYMLNCGLGIVFMLVAAVLLLIKGSGLGETLTKFLGTNGRAELLACAAVCLCVTMNDITAPSVSLEGKSLWLAQSFPITGWQALAAKLKLHLLMTIPPLLVLVGSVELMLKPALTFAILIPVIAVLFAVLMACFGLAVNLRSPNLNWTSEIVPIKQSMGVMLALFGGWLLVIAFGALYFAVKSFLSPLWYLVCAAALLLLASAGLLLWLKGRGARIFEGL